MMLSRVSHTLAFAAASAATDSDFFPPFFPPFFLWSKEKLFIYVPTSFQKLSTINI